ncbi:MAG: sigma-70 family RNA polymerase sigma factor [Chitinophagales bacterium]
MEDPSGLSVNNNEKVIEEAYHQFNRPLSSFIRNKAGNPEDAEDILQDVWFQLSRLESPELIEDLSGWLFTIARHKIIDKSRRKKPWLIDDSGYENADSEVEYPALLLANDSDPETEFHNKAFTDELLKALADLPENQRSVFIKNELEGITLQKIAEETGENLKTIISRKHYAMVRLRNQLGHFYVDYIND